MGEQILQEMTLDCLKVLGYILSDIRWICIPIALCPEKEVHEWMAAKTTGILLCVMFQWRKTFLRNVILV